MADELEFWKAKCDKKNSEIVRLREEKRIAEEHAADLVMILERMVGRLEAMSGQLGGFRAGL